MFSLKLKNDVWHVLAFVFDAEHKIKSKEKSPQTA